MALQQRGDGRPRGTTGAVERLDGEARPLLAVRRTGRPLHPP